MLNNFFEEFEKIELVKVPDGMGGFIPFNITTIKFKAGLTTSKTVKKLLSEQYGAENSYILALPKDIELNLGDIFRRFDSEKYYKVINDPEDFKVPGTSSMDFKQALVIRYVLPK